MTKNTWLKAAGALAITSIATVAIAADHRDAPGVLKDPTTDINDVYTWTAGDKVVLAMTVFPAAAKDSKFSDKVQYIFHTTSGKTFGESAKTLDVVCTFDAGQAITCMAGPGAGMPAVDKATGDASGTMGIESEGKKMKVFAGLRKDPFYFNLEGFEATTKIVKGANLPADKAGCPTVDMPTSTVLVNQLKSADGGGPATDFFAPLNGLAIVIELDKTLLTEGGAIMSVWGSTNTAP